MPDLYIDGAMASAREGERREIRCPADGSLVAEVDEAGAEDTGAAIAAARAAFDTGAWPALVGARARRRCCTGSPTCWSATRPTVARAESLDTGKRLVESEYDVDDVVGVFRHYAQRRGRGRRPGRRHRAARRGQPHRARAGRRLRR